MGKIKKIQNNLPQPSSWPADMAHNSANSQNQEAAVVTDPMATMSVGAPKITPPSTKTATIATTEPREAKLVSERLAQRQADATAAVQNAQQNYNSVRSAFEQYHDDYVSGRRNAVSDMITKPKRDEAKERRLKQASIVSLIADTLGLVGKGYAAAHGVKPTVTEGVASMRSMAELGRLDDIYREEGYRYDQQNLMDALRRREAADRMQQHRLSLAHDDLRDARAKDAAAQNMILSQELSAQERAYAERTRKEENARSDKRFSQQLAASAAGRGGRDDDYSYKHIAMIVQDPVTGERVPIYNGQFSMLLNDAIRKTPKLQSELESAQGSNQAAFDSKRMQIVAEEYTMQRKSKGDLSTIVKNDAENLKQRGETQIAISDLRADLGGELQNVSDDQLIKSYKEYGVEVTK